MTTPRFINFGDSALTIEFGDSIDRQLVAAVAALDARLAREISAGRLAGVIETVPTYRSLTILFDPLKLSRITLQGTVELLLGENSNKVERPTRHWRLPVCYGEEFGPDLETVAAAGGCTPEAVVDLHAGRRYLVYMIGFLPGFPFMGDVAPALHMPRRTEPRTRVPAGSVAIAGPQTAIYPWESPGGWQLIGRCPLPLFDPHRVAPALLAPGDTVDFEAIAPARFQELAQAVQSRSLDLCRFLLPEVNA